MTMNDNQEQNAHCFQRLVNLRERLFTYIKKALEEDECCKSNEGAFELHMPSYLDSEWRVVLHCYVIGPNRHYMWSGSTFDEAVTKAENAVNSWCDEWDGYDEHANEAL